MWGQVCVCVQHTPRNHCNRKTMVPTSAETQYCSVSTMACYDKGGGAYTTSQVAHKIGSIRRWSRDRDPGGIQVLKWRSTAMLMEWSLYAHYPCKAGLFIPIQVKLHSQLAIDWPRTSHIMPKRGSHTKL